MRVLGKVKMTVVSLHQTHHSRHYSKLFHKIMYYRKCKLYLVYFHVRFAASSFSWKKQSNLFYQENHEINKICIVSQHFKQFFVILFLLIFLQIVPFFCFGWPRKSFLLDKRLRSPGEEVWYYDGRALNVMTAMYKHINPTFPVPWSPTSYSFLY